MRKSQEIKEILEDFKRRSAQTQSEIEKALEQLREAHRKIRW